MERKIMKNTKLNEAVTNSLEYLILLVQNEIQPQEAKSGLNLLQQEYPDIKMNLVWEEEAYDRSIHYDTLLHLPDTGCVSLSFCPEKTLPWPMRGIHRWREGDLVKVNNTLMTVSEAIANLDFIWNEKRLINRLIDACIIREELDNNSVNISDAELQQTMNSFREERQLYTVEDTYNWMQQNGLNHERFESLMTNKATVNKIRDRVAAKLVEDYFNRHQSDFDVAYVARFDVKDREEASKIYEQIRQGKVDFYEALQHHFVTKTQKIGQSSRGFFSVIQRRELTSPLKETIFATEIDSTVELFYTGETYAIFRVLSLIPANLDDKTRIAIRNLIFEQWLAQKRQEAKIDWYWGVSDLEV
jgi:putative peptide maturation system protein